MNSATIPRWALESRSLVDHRQKIQDRPTQALAAPMEGLLASLGFHVIPPGLRIGVLYLSRHGENLEGTAVLRGCPPFQEVTG